MLNGDIRDPDIHFMAPYEAPVIFIKYNHVMKSVWRHKPPCDIQWTRLLWLFRGSFYLIMITCWCEGCDINLIWDRLILIPLSTIIISSAHCKYVSLKSWWRLLLMKILWFSLSILGYAEYFISISKIWIYQSEIPISLLKCWNTFLVESPWITMQCLFLPWYGHHTYIY